MIRAKIHPLICVRINIFNLFLVALKNLNGLEIVKIDLTYVTSIGAVVENFVQAASSFGYHVETTVIARNSFDPDLVKLNISKSKPLNISLQKILARRTVRSNMLSKELKASDVDNFSKFVGSRSRLFYFPAGTDHAKLMDKEAVDNYITQSDHKKAMEELASWVRLNNFLI